MKMPRTFRTKCSSWRRYSITNASHRLSTGCSTRFTLRSGMFSVKLRTLRQARIRLDMAAKIYEVDPRQSAYVVKLLKAEEELLETHRVAGKQHPDLYAEGDSSLRWSGNLSDLAELIYGLHTASCINDGRCDIKEIAEGFERLFNVRLPHIYNRFIAIRNRKNERAVFLRKLYEMPTCKLDELDR